MLDTGSTITLTIISQPSCLPYLQFWNTRLFSFKISPLSTLDLSETPFTPSLSPTNPVKSSSRSSKPCVAVPSRHYFALLTWKHPQAERVFISQVLNIVSQSIAPITPYLAEELYSHRTDIKDDLPSAFAQPWLSPVRLGSTMPVILPLVPFSRDQPAEPLSLSSLVLASTTARKLERSRSTD